MSLSAGFAQQDSPQQQFIRQLNEAGVNMSDNRLSGLGSIVSDPGMLSALRDAYDLLYQKLLVYPDAAVAYAATPLPGVSNIVGLGVGRPGPGGRGDEEPSLRVMVRRKLPRDKLPEDAQIPHHLNNIPIHVDEVGNIEAFQGFRGAYRPVLAGISGGLADGHGAGTLGSFVIPRDRQRKKRLMLTNHHVVAGANLAQIGADVVQPAVQDGGMIPDDIIGKVYQYWPIDLDLSNENEIDAALVELSPHPRVRRQKRIMRSDQKKGYAKSDRLKGPERRVQLGMVVQKSGRTTGHTMGTVDLLNVAITVGYGASRTARFVNQFRVFNPQSPFSAPGDSGSLVTTAPDNEAVGLLFAGSMVEGRTYTFCNDIRTVMKLLAIRMDC